MNRALSITLSALALGAHGASAQDRIPIVNLPPASARTTTTLGGIIGLHEVTGGKVLVNDASRRQLKWFDTTLASMTVVADSTSGNSNSYGPAQVALTRYVGDSSLVVDLRSRSLLVLDGGGQVTRAIGLPNPADFIAFAVGYSAVDSKGRLFYRGSPPLVPPTANGQPGPPPGDSVPILRADLDQRRIDTVGQVRIRDGNRQIVDRSNPARTKVTAILNPLQSLDEWALLTDGSVALIRAHDYHIDWVRPDGRKVSSPKLPFDWKRLTDDDKQKLVDSARAAQAALAASRAANAVIGGIGGIGGVGGGGRGGSSGGADPAVPTQPPLLETTFVPLKDITDFYPPIRRGAAMPDLDGNVWILPTTSAQSQHGELIYDVVNSNGELFERVRLPAGRSLAGFASGGVVYLQSGDRTNGFYLERTRLDAKRK